MMFWNTRGTSVGCVYIRHLVYFIKSYIFEDWRLVGKYIYILMLSWATSISVEHEFQLVWKLFTNSLTPCPFTSVNQVNDINVASLAALMWDCTTRSIPCIDYYKAIIIMWLKFAKAKQYYSIGEWVDVLQHKGNITWAIVEVRQAWADFQTSRKHVEAKN